MVGRRLGRDLVCWRIPMEASDLCRRVDLQHGRISHVVERISDLLLGARHQVAVDIEDRWGAAVSGPLGDLDRRSR